MAEGIQESDTWIPGPTVLSELFKVVEMAQGVTPEWYCVGLNKGGIAVEAKNL
jgi:hypothetical protein